MLVPGTGGAGGAPLSGSALAAAQAATAPGSKVVHVRTSAGEKWVDPTLAEWPESACLAQRSRAARPPDALLPPAQTTTASLWATWARR